VTSAVDPLAATRPPPDVDPTIRLRPAPPDPNDPRMARRGPPALRPFNDLAVLTTADVHVARRLVALGRDTDEAVLLGAALAVRALRLGHVCVDLADVHRTATSDTEHVVDLSHLPWPAPATWRDRMVASTLVGDGDEVAPDRPLRLVGSRLYLDRYWRQECQVAADLTARSLLPVPGVDLPLLQAGLARLWAAPLPSGTVAGSAATRSSAAGAGAGPDLQRLAGAAAVLHRFAVVAGGPGTGKTTTVARILALVADQAGAGGTTLRIALAAPTGKAAARLEEAVHDEARRLPVTTAVRELLLDLDASTLHRLLGWRPDSHSRFRHNRSNHLPHDVVIVDEASMVSLSLMAKLVEAVRPDARLILVGDPEQLASVEAGAVLGDIVGPAGRGLRVRPGARRELGQATGQPVPATDPPGATAIGDGIVVLRRVHRYGGEIAALAEAVQRGDEDSTMALLRSERADLTWIPLDDVAAAPPASTLQPVQDRILTAGRALVGSARAGDGVGALQSLAAVRVLCAHREGPAGVGAWTERIEAWLAAGIDGYATSGRWYVGRPVLVTENDYELQLYNGDTGVVIDAPAAPTVVFERRGDLYTVAPARLGHVQTLHAMTVHKSQGSQFGAVVVALPEPSSRVLTRELLYTAITRAQRHLTLVGTEASVRSAVGRPIARATGLRERLWW
jgi:exodeoxyribonuclease V alpha subunit